MSFKKNLSTLLAAAAAMLIGASPAVALPVSGQGTWETTLQARDLNGDSVTDAYYDTARNITWLGDANANGTMTWSAANTWAGNLVVGVYDDWRLPTMVDTGTPGCDFSYAGGTDCGHNVQTAGSEMAHLWYVTLGNKSFYDTSGNPNQPGWGLTNTANFLNLQSNFYWSGLEYAPSTGGAWSFSTSTGRQNGDFKIFQFYAMAVRPGDVAAAVPEPASLLMLLIGLGALVALRRRQPFGASAL